MNFKIQKYIPLLIAIIVSIFLYGSFGYQLKRENSLELLGLYVGLFFLYLYLLNCRSTNWTLLIAAAVLFRLIFLVATPNLSQDFYRFIWDGHLIQEGINPFLHTPNELLEKGAINIPNRSELFNGMGSLSAANHSNYPAINQLLFWISAGIGGTSILSSVIVLRLLIVIADIGIVFFGLRLLKLLKLPKKLIFLYALNPLVIIELTGNLHFEGAMLFFLIVSLWQLQKGNWQWSALFLALSISTKLIPLMFLPLYYQFFKENYSNNSKRILMFISYICLTLGFVVLSFLPFMDQELIHNYLNTVGLWFNKFEFNASIYYLLREIGYAISGYNQIAFIGKLLAVIVIIGVGFLTFFRGNKNLKDLISSMVLALAFYFFLSTTVHPWYLITMVGLSMFTPFRFSIIWTLMVMLSYTTYANPDFKENQLLLALEYAVVIGYFVMELRKNKEILNWFKPWQRLHQPQ